jgi:urease beta subunit
LPHFQAPEAVAVDALGNAVFSDEPTNRLMRVYWAGLKLIHISSHFHHIFITFHHISSHFITFGKRLAALAALCAISFGSGIPLEVSLWHVVVPSP